MEKCRFTIITVCYNAQDFIVETIKSVLGQIYTRFEYIIKDGDSSDGTLDVVRRLTENDDRVTVIQGRDQGIYDAMNIALLQAKGEYVLFLNAGDILHSETLLCEIAELMGHTKSDVYYGNVVQIDKEEGVPRHTERLYGKNSIKKIQFAFGRCLCHQSMFARRELFSKKDFNVQFHVCADREWQLYFLFADKKRFSYIPVIVSDVLTDGYSKQHVCDLEREVRKCVQLYCKGYLWIYDCIMILKKNALLKKLLQKIDTLFQMRGSKKDEWL